MGNCEPVGRMNILQPGAAKILAEAFADPVPGQASDELTADAIETIVGAHPAVRHVAVIGRADAKWGERPVLIVERGGATDARALLDLLRGKVADWWIPDRVAEVAEMPLAASGKIDKNRLRADYEAGKIAAVVMGR